LNDLKKETAKFNELQLEANKLHWKVQEFFIFYFYKHQIKKTKKNLAQFEFQIEDDDGLNNGLIPFHFGFEW